MSEYAVPAELATPAWERVMDVMADAGDWRSPYPRQDWRPERVRAAIDEAAYVLAGHEMDVRRRLASLWTPERVEAHEAMLREIRKVGGPWTETVDLGPVAVGPTFHMKLGEYRRGWLLRLADEATGRRHRQRILDAAAVVLAILVTLWVTGAGAVLLEFLHWNIIVLGWERMLEIAWRNW